MKEVWLLIEENPEEETEQLLEIYWIKEIADEAADYLNSKKNGKEYYIRKHQYQ